MTQFIRIHPDNPQERFLEQAVQVLKQGGIIIYPTDTIYAMGCDLYNPQALKRLVQLKGAKAQKMNLSFICHDLSDITRYVRQIDTPTFRLLKKALPGPYTFIMEASNQVPKLVDAKKKQVGIRIPDNNITRELVRLLGNPLVSTSLRRDDDHISEYFTDPSLIFDAFGGQVDMVIDGGYGNLTPSTVVDCTDNSFTVLRQGAGDIEQFL